MHHQNVGHKNETRDGHDVTNKNTVHFLIKCRIDSMTDWARRSVWPSGAARTTASVPIFPLAPGRFSTMKGCPNRSDNHWPITRATMSDTPPAAKPTMIRTGRVE